MRPVFIGGCSRSGTTLLGAMLGVGPDLLTVPEAEFKWEMLRAGLLADGAFSLSEVRRYLSEDPRFALWDVELAEKPDDRVPYPALLRELAAAYGRQAGKPEARVWFDHTPGNIRFGRSLHESFPEARFLHLVRDGRAVAASVIPLDWGPNTAREAAHHWATQVCAGLALQAWLGEEQVHLVHYEDLVREPQQTLRSVCDFLGIPYSEDMITVRDYRVQKWTAQQHALVAGAPDPARLTAWRSALTPAQIRDFERTTGELLDYLGYDTDHGATAGRPGSWEGLRTTAWAAARRLAVDKVRFRLRSRQLSEH